MTSPSFLPPLVLNQGLRPFPYWSVLVVIDFFFYRDTNLRRHPHIVSSLLCLPSDFYGGYCHVKNLKCCKVRWSFIFFPALLWLRFLKRTLLSCGLFFPSHFLFASLLISPLWSKGLGKSREAWPRCVPVCYFPLWFVSSTIWRSASSQISVLRHLVTP